MIALVRALEGRLPNKHLIFGSEAFSFTDHVQLTEKTFEEMDYDVVNIHPLSKTAINGRVYDLGEFMSGELRLKNYHDYCLQAYARGKPFNMDEDNAASCYKNERGWAVHRKRAWTTLFCGGHYDYIDFSITPYLETGTPASQKGIRAYMAHLATYLRRIGLAGARPALEIIASAPEGTVCSALIDGKAYHIYIANAAEYGEPDYGRAIANGALTLALSIGDYDVDFYSPVTGMFSPICLLKLCPVTPIRLPDFGDDLVIRVREA